MLKLKKVTGTWRGTYSYSLSDRMPAHDPVPFEIILKQGWFGHFIGTVTDDAVLGMPGTGVIDGYFSFPRIEFTKQMPVSWIFSLDGRRGPLREFLIEKGYEYNHDVPHRPIFYKGEFLDPTYAQGTWLIPAGSLSLGNGGGLKMAETKGVWNIENMAA